jgi:hypothetical protein
MLEMLTAKAPTHMSKHVAIGVGVLAACIVAGIALAVVTSDAGSGEQTNELSESRRKTATATNSASPSTDEVQDTADGLIVAPVQETASAPSAPLKRVGDCADTTISQVGTRLTDENDEPVADSGSSVLLANGVYGVSYDQISAVDQSRVGDAARTCLIEMPQDCPPGDDRGRVYETTNLRTGERWSLADSQHMCGGA